MLLLLTLAALVAGVCPLAAQEKLIEIKAIAGLRYDVPRFKVAPGEKVRLVVENIDDMAHNLVITAPGARLEVANAAMTLPLTPTQNFIPKSDKVLWAIPVLTPGKSGEVRFTAPETEGVYPYVCTYPGHGMIMYGAMYVMKKEMPPLAKDPNVPDTAKEFADTSSPHAFNPKPPYLYRMFVRDSGPASIAVALPGGQNYVWDAGACRLRYAWRGGFLDPMPHWRGNGDAFAEVKGRIYWRAGAEFPLRIGAHGNVPKVQFKGYQLVNRYPEFRYEVDGVEVRELIKAPHHGSGLEIAFTLGATAAPVFYIADENGGAKFASSAGQFKDGVLELTSEQARSFTVTLTEVPGREALAYFSMDDILSDKKPLPVEGVRGRALAFDGKKSQFNTGMKTDALTNGATFALWVKAKDPKAKEQVVLGAKSRDQEFALGWNLGAASGFSYRTKSALTEDSGATATETDGQWHHLAITIDGRHLSLFCDGKMTSKAGTISTSGLTTTGADPVFPAKASIFLGSVGGAKFAAATLDEVRIYDRVLTEAEIRALYESDRHAVANPASPTK